MGIRELLLNIETDKKEPAIFARGQFLSRDRYACFYPHVRRSAIIIGEYTLVQDCNDNGYDIVRVVDNQGQAKWLKFNGYMPIFLPDLQILVFDKSDSHSEIRYEFMRLGDDNRVLKDLGSMQNASIEPLIRLGSEVAQNLKSLLIQRRVYDSASTETILTSEFFIRIDATSLTVTRVDGSTQRGAFNGLQGIALQGSGETGRIFAVNHDTTKLKTVPIEDLESIEEYQLPSSLHKRKVYDLILGHSDNSELPYLSQLMLINSTQNQGKIGFDVLHFPTMQVVHSVPKGGRAIGFDLTGDIRSIDDNGRLSIHRLDASLLREKVNQLNEAYQTQQSEKAIQALQESILSSDIDDESENLMIDFIRKNLVQIADNNPFYIALLFVTTGNTELEQKLNAREALKRIDELAKFLADSPLTKSSFGREYTVDEIHTKFMQEYKCFFEEILTN